MSVGVLFQSTPPWGGEQPAKPASQRRKAVSIHAPVGGRTIDSEALPGRLTPFQSTPPWGGERPACRAPSRPSGGFQSTPPWGGEPSHTGSASPQSSFNPRPRGGGERKPNGQRRNNRKSFNPRPRGGRTASALRSLADELFVSIHAPVGGRTHVPFGLTWHATVSIHAPVGGRTVFFGDIRTAVLFQSTPPWGGERGIYILPY